jgi:hypothetical protein
MTGDFISFSHFNPMEIQIATGFDATSSIERTFGFWPSVGETAFPGVFLRLLSFGLFARRAEIDDICHSWSGLSVDVSVFLPRQDTSFANRGHNVAVANCDTNQR